MVTTIKPTGLEKTLFTKMEWGLWTPDIYPATDRGTTTDTVPGQIEAATVYGAGQ